MKIKNLIKKLITTFCTKEIILYGIFGVLTTAINFGTFQLLNGYFNINENISNIIAIFLAVLFAYFTNKDLVFHSKATSLKEKINELIKFFSGRAFTMIFEFVGCALLFLTPIHKTISKLFITILVIILNFFISKFFAFKTKEHK